MDNSSLPGESERAGHAIAPNMTNQGYPGYVGSMELANAIRARGSNMASSGNASDGVTSSGAGADGSAGNINTM